MGGRSVVVPRQRLDPVLQVLDRLLGEVGGLKSLLVGFDGILAKTLCLNGSGLWSLGFGDVLVEVFHPDI